MIVKAPISLFDKEVNQSQAKFLLVQGIMTCWYVFIFWIFVSQCMNVRSLGVDDYTDVGHLEYQRNPAPDGHRCGVCPTYFQKICAFDHLTNSTFIFDNHCIMDLYNCKKGNAFVPMKYEHCIYFGNFAYVHGFKYEDMDYEEDHFVITSSKKNPSFVRRLAELKENIFDFNHYFIFHL